MADKSPEQSKLSRYLGDPALILAIVATVVYYGILFQPGMHGTLLYRYTAEHAVEYVIVALFLWGMIDVLLKLTGFPREMLAMQRTWLPPRQGREPVAQAQVMLDGVRAQPARMLHSRIGRRLVESLTYVVEKDSADEYADHLRYLALQDEDLSYSRYSLIRFVVAVTPILGFLGTVVHFGTALGGFSFDDVDEKLPLVIAEMGTAFNTTTVALGAAMVTMFAMFLCERLESSLIGRIDRLVERELLNRFEVKDANLTPFLVTLQTANRELHGAVEQALERQIEAWSGALDRLFSEFDKRQKAEEQRWQLLCTQLVEQHQTYDASRDERVRQMLALVEARHEKHLGQIQAILERAGAFSGDVSNLAKTLNQIGRGEGRLIELQSTLTENLRVLHETHQIDGALHGLTAAIHLLTVRNGNARLSDAA